MPATASRGWIDLKQHCFPVLAVVAAGILAGCQLAVAAPAAPAPVTPDQEAVVFVQDILRQRPTQELTMDAVLHLRSSRGRRTQIPLRYAVQLEGERSWRSIYVTGGTDTMGPERLVVIHQPGHPNRYLFTQISLDGSRTNSMSLTNGEAAVSFAGSDFWLSDLGLEFLHWPEQRFIRDAKITMRWGRPMKVVESINPRPAGGNYARVLSWIDSELGSVVRAEAFDAQGKRFKAFELKSFKKVDGRWHVKDMEIRNDQADTRTRLEFSFETE